MSNVTLNRAKLLKACDAFITLWESKRLKEIEAFRQKYLGKRKHVLFGARMTRKDVDEILDRGHWVYGAFTRTPYWTARQAIMERGGADLYRVQKMRSAACSSAIDTLQLDLDDYSIISDYYV